MNTEVLLKDLKETLQKYDGQLWYIKCNGMMITNEYLSGMNKYNYVKEFVYIGSEEDVRKVMDLLYWRYTMEKFDITKHKILHLKDNPKKDYEDAWIPQCCSDIIEYRGKEYKIEGFRGRNPVIKLEDNKEIELKDKTEYKLVKSYFYEHIKQKDETCYL